MTRRSFLAVAGGVATAVLATIVARRRASIWRLADEMNRLEGFGLLPKTRLRYRYRWLDVEPAVFDSYVADYERHFGRLDRFSIPQSSFFTQFLLSTNFFSARRPNGKPVAYTVFYSPDTSPCYNPLAQPPPSATELGHEARRFFQ